MKTGDRELFILGDPSRECSRHGTPPATDKHIPADLGAGEDKAAAISAGAASWSVTEHKAGKEEARTTFSN